MSSVMFLADENLRGPIVYGVRRQQANVDILTIQDAGLSGQDDFAVLALGFQLGRVIISHDVNTMPAHFGTWLSNGHQSSGIILIAQSVSNHDAIETILLVWEASLADEWVDRLDFLP